MASHGMERNEEFDAAWAAARAGTGPVPRSPYPPMTVDRAIEHMTAYMRDQDDPSIPTNVMQKAWFGVLDRLVKLEAENRRLVQYCQDSDPNYDPAHADAMRHFYNG